MLVAIPAALAALVHVYIFVIESLRFTDPATMRTFGVRSHEDAEIMRPWAFNQGFYNLFLAIVTVVGLVLHATDHQEAGTALVASATASMLAAAVVLIAGDRSKARAASVQGLFPMLTLLALVTVGW
ncbi:DUF1304 domain-containing protein [Luteipulveratus flavus]|uniref:DUF1304 domain-containing protein n=1 Tax=Luteipulveratus flavus TaxID=3031728 RepID=A0ABT6CCX2_9MICO|nr:DUF1304 domain-containing protein [Luteipulveratus sp. YIM 133296]MDF8265121.1 DUF1304 domain-containing protein [Luteipulveratus sp. YIM 133296]